MVTKDRLKKSSLYKLASYVKHPSRAVRDCAALRRIAAVKRGKPERLTGGIKGGPEIVVSLTSYGDRLKTAHLAIRSLMLQTVLPDRIALYLDGSISRSGLSDELLDLESYGLEIRIGCEDLGPHKKYVYAFQDFSGSLVITADDDLVYARDTVETLLRAHEQLPGCVVARRCHLIGLDREGRPLPYSKWDMEYKDPFPVPRRRLLATNGGGSLFPTASFDLSKLDMDAIRGVAWPADDLYLKFFELINGVEVAYAPNGLNHPYVLPGTQENGLFKNNVGDGRNDAIMRELMGRYGFGPSVFCSERTSFSEGEG